jgi:hypothetical protein
LKDSKYEPAASIIDNTIPVAAKIEFGENKFQVKTKTFAIFFVIGADTAFFDDVEIVEKHRISADADVFEGFYFWYKTIIERNIFKNIKFRIGFIEIFWTWILIIDC